MKFLTGDDTGLLKLIRVEGKKAHAPVAAEVKTRQTASGLIFSCFAEAAFPDPDPARIVPTVATASDSECEKFLQHAARHDEARGRLQDLLVSRLTWLLWPSLLRGRSKEDLSTHTLHTGARQLSFKHLNVSGPLSTQPSTRALPPWALNASTRFVQKPS